MHIMYTGDLRNPWLASTNIRRCRAHEQTAVGAVASASSGDPTLWMCHLGDCNYMYLCTPLMTTCIFVL